MNLENISSKLIPLNYLTIAENAQKSQERKIRELFEKRNLPTEGWNERLIEKLVLQLSSLDSNNFPEKAGLGEREARIVCGLVARRHYGFSHGIGRSGDLLEAQPKAAGSTLLANLTNALLLDLIKHSGVPSCQSCFLVPMATGMTLTLCMLSLRKMRPDAKYVLWSRIDQKSCFKSITTAGLTPVIIDMQLVDNQLVTDCAQFEKHILDLNPESILCLFSTSSCFAPRNCDDLLKVAGLAKRFEIPHLVNNAYGIQSTQLTHKLQQAYKGGRVDLFVQSTDKNLMVPVGGAIVAGFDNELVANVSKTYAGRASSSQTLDVFMTLLHLGKNGFTNLIQERKTCFEYLRQQLDIFACRNNFKVFECKGNRISIAISLPDESTLIPTKLTQFGSMLYCRGVSGSRMIVPTEEKTIDRFSFQNWGMHRSVSYSHGYLTVAAGIGITKSEIDLFMKKLNEAWCDFVKK